MNPLELIAWWIALAVCAHALHVGAGCLSVGPSEVRRQVSEAYDGAAGYLLFVLSVGLYSGGVNEVKDAEPPS